MKDNTTRRFGFTGRQVNLLLEMIFVALILSGLASWLLNLDQAWIATTVHAVAAIVLLGVAPLKLRGPVRTGFKRRRATRWVSALFGVMILSGTLLGFLHSTGVWWGIGYWSAMWTHLLLGFTGIPFFLWHVVTRPVRPKMVDVDRRGLVTSAGLAAASAAVWGLQEVVVGVAGADGAYRARTGSHEVGSFDPRWMPTNHWINDQAPKGDLSDWVLRIEGEPVEINALAARAKPLITWLDCTDGWRSEQSWDVVPLAEVLSDRPGRSIRVTSYTGYSRLFARGDAHGVFLCFGYNGEPLRRGHGAPVRLVVPNRRGPWWVKWIDRVELSDRPFWLQLPLPAS